MSFIRPYSIVFLFGVFIFMKDASSNEGYELRRGESVSELLFRLKLTPMYENGFLDEILKYNDLNRRSARKLRPGTKVNLPERFSVAPEVPQIQLTKEELPVKEPQSVPSEIPVSKISYIGLGLHAEELSGDSPEQGIFNLQVLRPSLILGKRFKKGKSEWDLSGQASFIKLGNDPKLTGTTSFFMGQFQLSYSILLAEALRTGLHVQYGQELYVQFNDDEKYLVRNPWIYALGPGIGFKRWHLRYLYVPDQEIKPDFGTKSNFRFQLGYHFPIEFCRFESSLSYHNISTKAFDAKKVGVGAQCLREF